MHVVRLRADASPVRAALWRRILGCAEVPVLGPLAEPMVLDGTVRDYYRVDVRALRADQLGALIRHAAELGQLALSEASARVVRDGFPVLADDVTLHSDAPWFL